PRRHCTPGAGTPSRATGTGPNRPIMGRGLGGRAPGLRPRPADGHRWRRGPDPRATLTGQEAAMTRLRIVLLVAILAVSLAAERAAAVISPSGIDPRLRLDWEAGQRRDGRPVISGYIYNDYMRAANNVRFLAE